MSLDKFADIRTGGRFWIENENLSLIVIQLLNVGFLPLADTSNTPFHCLYYRSDLIIDNI